MKSWELTIPSHLVFISYRLSMSLSPRRRSLWSNIPFTRSLESCFYETQLKETGHKNLVKTPEKNCSVQNSKKIPSNYPEKGKFQQKWTIFQQRCRKHLSLELHWLSKWLKKWKLASIKIRKSSRKRDFCIWNFLCWARAPFGQPFPERINLSVPDGEQRGNSGCLCRGCTVRIG